MRDAIFGLIIGDALGVPVEFNDRQSLRSNPVVDMRAYGTYMQPKGTWSDDSSMMLCLMESLSQGLDYDDQMRRFLRWADEAYMTPHDEVFDMGVSTRKALLAFAHGAPALECGATAVNENGNGSLMRILPLAFFLRSTIGPDFSQGSGAYEIIHNCSSLTHAHPISKMACGIYCSVINELINIHTITPNRQNFVYSAVETGIDLAKSFYKKQDGFNEWLPRFRRVDADTLLKLKEEDIQSTGYVIYTLEAALWCLLHTNDFQACLLKAVNLGDDTDTVAAVTGGMAGCIYPLTSLPMDWVDSIVRKDMVEELYESFEAKLDILNRYNA